MALDTIAPDLDGAGLRIGIVRSRFNAWAGEALLESCVSELRRLGVDDDDVTHVTVPGALEVPVALSKLAQAQDYDALIALGCVIRGDTFHFEVVATESAHGISRVALELGGALRAFEVNPLWVNGDQVEALDVLVITEPDGSSGTE